jgi:hypothetical protein
VPIAGALEAWHVPDDLADAVCVSMHVVDVASQSLDGGDVAVAAAAPAGRTPKFCVRSESVCTLKVTQVSVMSPSGADRTLSVLFSASDLKVSCQYNGCPFVISVAIAAQPGVAVHLLTLPFFVNHKQPKVADAKGPQIRSAARFAALKGLTQSELHLGIDARGEGGGGGGGGSLGNSARRWPEQFTPPQQLLIASALSRSTPLSIADLASKHAGEGGGGGSGISGGGNNRNSGLGGGSGSVLGTASASAASSAPRDALAARILVLCRTVPHASERVMAELESVYAALHQEAAAAATAVNEAATNAGALSCTRAHTHCHAAPMRAFGAAHDKLCALRGAP